MIVIVMGVSGCGKSTVGRRLAETCGWHFLDADDFHPVENVAKMRAGVPLNDADRAGWLTRLREEIEQRLTAGHSAVLACSALRATYRDVLRHPEEAVHFVHLRGEREAIRRRLEGRHGHYMPPGLLDSQFAALEEPADALVVPVELTPDDAVSKIVADLRLRVRHCTT